MTVSTENATLLKNRKTQISQYLAVKIQIEIELEFVPRNVSFRIWWILRVQQFQWNLSYTKQLKSKVTVYSRR